MFSLNKTISFITFNLIKKIYIDDYLRYCFNFDIYLKKKIKFPITKKTPSLLFQNFLTTHQNKQLY